MTELKDYQDKIIEQVNSEYSFCEKHHKTKLNDWLWRLKIYSNQRKEKQTVGDPLLFTIFQTIFASLYDDKIGVSFDPQESGDMATSENLNKLAEYDYQKMEKDIIDYEWNWDTMFFGRGFVFMNEFDRKKMHPVPEVVSPLLLLRDPKATSVNGNSKGFGGARFLGREMVLTKWQIENHGDYFNYQDLNKSDTEEDNLLIKSEKARAEAQGRDIINQEEQGLKDNAYFNILEWFTHIDGEKYLVALANNRTKLIRFTKLKDQEKWAIIDRVLFPISHDWDGVSIPDLIEDKQRARARLINDGLKVAATNANPMYLFDTNRIVRQDNLNFEFNKFIGINGNPVGSIVPIQKDIVRQEVQWILDTLHHSAQVALSTPEIQSGAVMQEKRTLGELELVSSKVATRYSLTARVFGWSERRFWERWYWIYKNFFQDNIDEKVLRLVGVWGVEFRKITRENIIAKIDPDIRVESTLISQSKKITQRELFRGFITMSAGVPDFPIRYALKELAKMSDFRTDQITILFPPNQDEIQAEKENKEIEDNKTPIVSLTDNHSVHRMIHSQLNQSKQRDKHLKFHDEAEQFQKENKQIFQEEPIQLNEAEMKLPEANIMEKIAKTGTEVPMI